MRKGSVQATVYTRTFSATPGPAYVDMDDLATAGADGSVTLNGVILMDVRAVTARSVPAQVGQCHLGPSNKLVVSLIGKSKSQLKVTVAQAVGRSCYPTLDPPDLALRNMVSDGVTDWYNFLVLNSEIYPAELFWPAPDLAPCGGVVNSSRTWVEIGSLGGPVLGFCTLASPTDLNTLWIAVPAGTPPPSPIQMRLWDRYCSIDYTSNPLQLPWNNQSINVSPGMLTLKQLHTGKRSRRFPSAPEGRLPAIRTDFSPRSHSGRERFRCYHGIT